MNGDDRLLIELATPASLDDALITLEARNDPCAYFLKYCEARQDHAQHGEFFRRLAGSVRKAQTLK
jgi:hypothetical protein